MWSLQSPRILEKLSLKASGLLLIFLRRCLGKTVNLNLEGPGLQKMLTGCAWAPGLPWGRGESPKICLWTTLLRLIHCCVGDLKDSQQYLESSGTENTLRIFGWKVNFIFDSRGWLSISVAELILSCCLKRQRWDCGVQNSTSEEAYFPNKDRLYCHFIVTTTAGEKKLDHLYFLPEVSLVSTYLEVVHKSVDFSQPLQIHLLSFSL